MAHSTEAVLLTGGAGYVGSHTAWALTDAGRDVVVLDDLSTGRRDVLPPTAKFVHGSIGNEAILAEILEKHRIKAIIHMAALTVVPDSIATPIPYYVNNVGNSLVLLKAALAYGVQDFVFSSTAAVYKPQGTVPLPESAPTGALSPYGQSKLMVETILADVGASAGLRWLALRYFNVAGADQAGRTGQFTPNASHLLKVACEVAVGRRPTLDIFGDDYETQDGTCVRDFIHVSDIADAHVKALDYLEADGRSRVLNCGYGQATSVKQIVAAIERITGTRLPTQMRGRRPGDAPFMVADSGAIRKVLGWRPRFADLDTIVGSALAWERAASLP